MSEKVELKPCPFCGMIAHITQLKGGKFPRYSVCCSNSKCFASESSCFGRKYYSDNEIIKETTQAVKDNLNAGCYVSELLRIIERQRVEAVKEFAERLKRNEGRRGVPIATIDNIAKEMVGEMG